MRTGRASRVDSGFGLVELMVAMALGLLVVSVGFQVFLSSKRTFDVQASLIARQEATRFAMNLLGRDLLSTGYRGCLRDIGVVRNTLNDADTFLYDFAVHVEGFDALGAAWSPGLPAAVPGVASGTDVLTVRAVNDTGAVISQSMPTQSADLKTTAGLDPPPVVNGDIALVSDCGGAAVFQVTQYTAANGNIVHNTGVGTPGNATQNLGRRFQEGSQLFTLRTTSYYIADSASGDGRALWRRIGTRPAEELAEGVENMQFVYGEDTDGDGVPDAWRAAGAVARWDRVTAVRVALLVASIRGRLSDGDGREFDLLGQTVGPFDDGRLRRALTTTLALRNRLP